ncbi:MAG: nucleoside transporter [Lentisphaerae bacterium RIFOXYC12_FULL_60_16]|nr:MAG: nucleoside transporter [Lentisphaerae bacterium RIFOXYC12_FULL_60_16]
MTLQNLVSALGLLVLMGLAWMCSTARRRVNVRVLVWGLLIQFGFAAILFHGRLGAWVMGLMNHLVVRLLACAGRGSEFVFGRLAVPPGGISAGGEPSLGFFLAFQAFPTIVFFSALMALLYHWRIMPWIIRGFAAVFTRLMRTSGAESLCAASNIFVGVESAAVVRPYLLRMTRSELCTVLTAGMATVASNVLAFYVYCLRDVFPGIAGHLVSASLLSAPAALVMSKLLCPETESPETLGRVVREESVRSGSMFEAIIDGSTAGMRILFGIVALLLAVLGLVALVDQFIGFAGSRVNLCFDLHGEWTLNRLLGYVFYVPALLMGVVPEDAGLVAGLLGERVTGTEVAGYQSLAILLQQGRFAEPRSVVLAAYALCGFAHVASVAIFVGGVSALAPTRAPDLAKLGGRALLAATLACLMTACVAGIFLTNESPLLGVWITGR